MNRRPSPRVRLLPLALLLGAMLFRQGAKSREPIDIGSRVEPFVDDYVIEKLAGKPIRLRFVLRDADLFSIRFQPEPAKVDRWKLFDKPQAG